MKITPYFFVLIAFVFFFTNCGQTKTDSAETQMQSTTSFVEWAQDAVIYEVNIRQYTEEGTIEAFRKHLPRLQETGIDILWLMPIFPIGEKFRKATQKTLAEEIEDPEEQKKYLGSYYAIKDYKDVNPEFGTMDEFKSLVKEIHELGMYVILDIAVNHTAWDHVWFETHPEFYTKVNTDSTLPWNPKWMEEHPEYFKYLKETGYTYPVDNGETDWWDTADLNYENQDLRSEMKEILKFWVEECDVDGYRCDVAGMVPTDFWEEASAQINQIKPVFMLAEWEGPELLKEAFDMDYNWHLMHVMNQIASGELDATYIDTVLQNKEKYEEDDIFMNFVTNHDENSWNGTVFERYGEGVEAFAALTFTFPGMPLLYSGQEAGLDKRLLFFEKDTIDWSDLKYEDFYKTLIELRTRNEALWSANKGGELIKLENSAPEKAYTFVRLKGASSVVSIFNLSDRDLEVSIQFDSYKGAYTEIFSGEEYSFEETSELSLPPYGYLILE